MFHRLTCRLHFVALLVVFMVSVVSCKKDDGTIATSSGLNRLSVEIDGQRYEPKRSVIGTLNDEPIVHQGVKFTTVDNFLRVKERDFVKSNVYHIASSAVLNTPTVSMLTFGLHNVVEPGQQDKMQPVVEGTYAVRGDDRPGIVAYCTYKVPGNWDFPYTAKAGSGTLTLTRFTDEVISGKMEVVVELGEGASYESKKIVLHFDYTMNTINNKVFH